MFDNPLVTLEVDLFFITIVMVTPCGRAAASQYVQQTLARFAAQSHHSDAALVLMAICALGCLLLMCGRAQEGPAAYWVWRKIDQDVSRKASRT